MLEKWFGLKAHQTTLKNEIVGGITTFLTMAYIIFVQPSMLAKTGMDTNAVFVATCISAAIGTFIMGFYANLPIALAPGMGLNAFFTYTVVLSMGYSWEVALGCVFWSGIAFVLLSLFKIREWVIQSIPLVLRRSISAGLGAFLAFIAFQNSGMIVDHPATLVHLSLENLKALPALMTILGLMLIVAFEQLKIIGSVMLSIGVVSVLGAVFGDNQLSANMISAPPSVAPTFMKLDLMGALQPAMISVIFAFFFVDLFDTAGTLIGVTHRAGLTTPSGEVPNLKKALLADSTATVVGSMVGTSSVTSYVESASGVVAGARTGLSSVVVGLLFLLALFFSPLLGMIPSYATTGAILYVAILMMYSLKDIDWHDLTEATPVALTFLMIPLSYSIADGITFGFISFVLVKSMTGKFKELNLGVLVLTAILLSRIIFL